MVPPETLPQTDAAVAWFALPPLSLSLLSDELSIRPYVTGENPPLSGEPQPTIVAAVDLDSWLTSFLGAVEEMLSTDYAAAAENAHAASLTAVRDAKLRLAAVLANRALPLFADTDADTAADRDRAVDAIITSLLVSLTNPDTTVAPMSDGLVAPAPRRAHPDPVTLISQQALQSVDEPTSAAEVTAWHLSVAFRHDTPDSYLVHASFNECPSWENTPASAADPLLTQLFRALAEFVIAWPELANDLVMLPALGPGVTNERATLALRAFAMLVDTVTSALALLDSPDRGEVSTDAAAVTIDGDGIRLAQIGALNVLCQASARSSISVVRNLELLPGRVTNPAFVYRGPATRFGAEVVPTIHGGPALNISGASVGDALGTFLRSLLTVPANGVLAHQLRLRLAASYCTDSATAPLPIFLLPSVVLRPASDWDWTVPGSFVAGVDGMVMHWLDAHESPTGTVRFEFSLFADDGRPKPLVQGVTLDFPLT